MKIKRLFSYLNEDTKSITDLIPWFEQITPNLIINNDGSLLAGFKFEGIDLTSTTQEEHDFVCNSFEKSLNIFNETNMIWSFLDKRRKKYQKNTSTEENIANFVNDQWHKHIDDGRLSFFENSIYISFSPFSNRDSFFDEVNSLMRDAEYSFFKSLFEISKEYLFLKTGLRKHKNTISESVRNFEIQIKKFTDSLSQIKISRLERNDLLLSLSNRVNLATPKQKILLPTLDLIYLNSFLTVDSIKRLDGGVLCFMGSQKNSYVSTLSIKGYPGFINNSDSEQILNVDGSFSLIQVFKFLNQSDTKNLIMKAEQIYRSQVKSPVVQMVEKITGSESNKINKGNLVLADDCQSALIEHTAEGVNFGYHSMSIVVIEEDLKSLDETQKKLSETLNNAGYSVVREVMYQMGAFLTSIPGVISGIIRSRLVSTRNLSDLIILRSILSGNELNLHLSEQRKIKSPYLCLMPTHTNVPEKFNFHVGDVGHFMVIGPSGSGKTTFMNFLMIQWQKYSPCKIIVIDKDKSCYLTLRSLGGSYISLNDTDENIYKMNPLLTYKDSKNQNMIEDWVVGLIESRDGKKISSRELLTIRTSMNMLASNSSVMTLSKLKQMIEGLDSALATRLSPWIKSEFEKENSINQIFDNERDDFQNELKNQKNGIIGIDFGGIKNDSILMTAILEYLFNSINEIVDGKLPTLIYLEEAWYLLQNQRFRNGFEDWIKTMRKRLAIVGISTQSVNDILVSGISPTINDNIKTRIYLSNSKINASRDVYKNILGFDDDQIEVIKNLKPKTEYLIRQEDKLRIVSLNLPANILAFTRSDQLAIDVFNEFISRNDLNHFEIYLADLKRVTYAN